MVAATCGCRSFDSPYIGVGYAPLCGLLRDGNTVMDVGCNDGRSINAVRDHLRGGHGIRVRVVGIDMCPTERMFDPVPGFGGFGGRTDALLEKAAAERGSLDAFILSMVENVRGLDGVADAVSCFGVWPPPETAAAAYRRMAALLKPSGVAAYYVLPRRWFLSRRVRGLRGLDPNPFVMKVMSKDEAAEHAELCVTFPGRRPCNHGRRVDIPD